MRAFNAAVRSRRLGADARRGSHRDSELRFENVPAGPFVGIDAIRRAYREQPPDDQIRLLGIQANDERGTVVAAFAWLAAEAQAASCSSTNAARSRA